MLYLWLNQFYALQYLLCALTFMAVGSASKFHKGVFPWHFVRWYFRNNYAQNFYVLKICLNSFEITIWGLKCENSIQIWKYFILSENLFQIWIPWSGAMCVYSTLSHEKVEYTHNEPLLRVHVWNQFSNGKFFFKFELHFQISKLDLGFQINSNGFSRDRSFQH